MPYENPSCYARKFGNCSSKRSAEHYVSESLLKQIADEAVTVAGLPFVPEDRTLGIKNLTSKILCSTHNSELSALDAVGGRFFAAVHQFNERLSAGDTTDETEHFNGPLLERFLLKIAIGLIASGNMKSSKTGKSPEILDSWLDLLFAKKCFGDFGDVSLMDENQVGLHIIPSNCVGLGKIFFCVPSILPTQHITHSWEFLLAGLPLALNLGKVCWLKPKSAWIYHPSTISFVRDETIKTLTLDWEENPCTQDAVTFTFQGNRDAHPLVSLPPKERPHFRL